MPRPGPRPYECVRRAWHSDRHQPIRGSIIRQIFRVATESHTSSTRKNREWQEKLPRVVLKAEEIMYSKANSEAEYVDPETLWERLNDAVDTIIRRDENETGQFLQPCIEAALVLGCVPVRASRSQRHTNPRSYLGPRFLEPPQAAPTAPDKTNHHRPPPSQPPTPSANQLNISRPANPLPNSQIAPNTSYIATHNGPHLRPNFHQPISPMSVELNNMLNYGSVYPLYYGCHLQNIEPRFEFRPPQNSNLNNIIDGTPVGWPAPQPAHYASTRNLLPGESANVATELRQVNPVDRHGKAPENECDLSLRLGPSDPCMNPVDKGFVHVTEGGVSSNQQESGSCSKPCMGNLEFSFLPGHTYSDRSKSYENRIQQEGEFQGSNVTSRKRKAQDHHETEDGSIQWLPELHPNQDGQIRWRGQPARYHEDLVSCLPVSETEIKKALFAIGDDLPRFFLEFGPPQTALKPRPVRVDPS